jgi:heme exporter protein C
LPLDTSICFTITGYNTHLEGAKDIQIWLKNGTDFYAVDSITPIINSTVKFNFSFPSIQHKTLAKNTFDIVVNDQLDGTITLREALPIVGDAGKGDSTNLTHRIPTTPEVKVGKFAGFAFPYREILYQSIRNVFYHVPMWFGMMIILIFSTVYSVRYLNGSRITDDIIASSAVTVALLYGLLGLATGMIWANYTWGEPWPNDPKLNGAAVGVIIYLAYIVLRGSLSDEIKRARISAVYNVFAIVIFTLFIFIIPRLTDSLHPGNGGNPAFSKYDLDSHLRAFFYPAVVGWTMLGFWLLSLTVRIKTLTAKKLDNE